MQRPHSPDEPRRDGWPRRLFGPRPGGTIFKLAAASIVVGGVLAIAGISPISFWRGLFDALAGMISLLGNTVGEVAASLATYFILGAAIVVPVWLLSRMLSGRKDRR